MCGYAGDHYALCRKKLGARKAELVKYMTSGEVSGDYTVVGYAGLIVK
jgi:AmmeMemoRadiSam system protein B